MFLLLGRGGELVRIHWFSEEAVGWPFQPVYFNLNCDDESHGFLATWEVPRAGSPCEAIPLCIS